MPKIYECQTARSDIIELIVLDSSTIAYSTLHHGVVFLDFYECETIKSVVNRNLNSNATAAAFSPNSKYFAFVNDKTIYIINLETKKTVQQIDTNNEIIDILSFDPSSTYILAGTKNGRVLQYKYDKTAILSRLCSFPYDRDSIYAKVKDGENYVSAFAYFNTTVACTGYGGAIFIMDLHTQAYKDTITHHRTRIDALCFTDENTLISGNSDGSIDITKLDNIKECKTIHTPLSKIKHIVVLPNPDFILVAGTTNVITIIDIKKAKVIHSKYAEFRSNIIGVSVINNDSIVVALENKKISYVELPSVDKLKSFILHNSYDKAYKLINTEPMLQGSLEHKILEEKFDEKYKEATNELINQHKTKARQALEAFRNVPSKQIQINNLFIAFDNFRRFHGLFLEKKYALAYAMCAKYEPLKQTVQYKKMEEVFKIAFANAQRQVIQGNINGAKALLHDYQTVIAKKPIINLILTQNKEFLAFLQAVKKKDYSSIEKLLKSNSMFYHIPNYLALQDEIEQKIENIKFSIKSGEIVVAKKLLYSIEGVPHIQDKVELLNMECKYMMMLKKAYNNDNFESCYTILDSHKFLASTELGILLEKHWNKIMRTCEEYALKGNIRDIKNTLGDLISLPTRRAKIGDLIRVSFHVRIGMLIKSSKFKSAEPIIHTYIDIFGKDSEIKQIIEDFEKSSSIKLAINESSQRPSRDSWIHSPLIMKRNS